jgi:hypothetical protein
MCKTSELQQNLQKAPILRLELKKKQYYLQGCAIYNQYQEYLFLRVVFDRRSFLALPYVKSIFFSQLSVIVDLFSNTFF